jgi:hypothetical protein
METCAHITNGDPSIVIIVTSIKINPVVREQVLLGLPILIPWDFGVGSVTDCSPF